MRRAILGMILAAGLVQAQTDAVQQEIARLKGTWSVVALEDPSGEKTPEEVLKSIKITFTDAKMIFQVAGQTIEATYKLDPAQKPPAIDVTQNRNGKPETALGIYRLAGDTLTFCATDPGRARPKEFKADAASKAAIMTLKRDKE